MQFFSISATQNRNVFVFLYFYSKAGIIDQFDGHSGPVTGISYHCVPGQVKHFCFSLKDAFHIRLPFG